MGVLIQVAGNNPNTPGSSPIMDYPEAIEGIHHNSN
jgi:hypothetical protein